MKTSEKARRRGDGEGTAAETLLDIEPLQDDLDTALKAAPGRARPGATAFLAAGVIAVAGFIGGVQAHKTWGGEESGGAAPSAVGGQNGRSGPGGPDGRQQNGS